MHQNEPKGCLEINNAKPSHTAAVWSIHNLATRRPHAVSNYSPVVRTLATAVVCYVLNENTTVTTTNLQASVRTQVHAVSMSSDGNVTVLWSQQMAGKIKWNVSERQKH